jgi:hypothetical protein
MQIDPAFARNLSEHDLDELERRRDTVFALSGERRLVYVNPAYGRFARENGAEWLEGAWELGASIDDAIPEPLRRFYDSLYETVRDTNTPVDHDYECSTPSAIRRLRMRVYPLRPAGWLVVNAIIAEGLDPGPSTAPDQHLYRVYGVIVVCCHCRRTRRASGGGAEQWDWVPAWLADAPAEVSHGLCPPCFAHHYPVGD